MTRRRLRSGGEASVDAARQLVDLQRRVERLAADVELVCELGLHRFEGPRWARFARVLAEYGFGVMRPWVATGRVFEEARRKKRPVVRDVRLRLEPDDVVELANETVGRAIRQFREKVLMRGKWEASRGASLTTYFIGQCVLQFPDVYRGWAREQCLQPEGWLPESAPASSSAALEATVDFLRLVERSDELAPELLVAAVEMGHSHAEVAQMTGLTLRAVESRIHRFSRRGAA